MKERPILFSTPMVKAILEGKKTVTRRVIATQPDNECYFQMRLEGGILTIDYNQGDENPTVKFPYGDIMWVRETWNKYVTSDCVGGVTTRYRYKADDKDECYQWKPSIHMPKEACRLKLKIVSIRVERLHDITEEDAKRECAKFWVHGHGSVTESEIAADPGYLNFGDYKTGFQMLWISINGQDSWDSNPWVWRIEFTKL